MGLEPASSAIAMGTQGCYCHPDLRLLAASTSAKVTGRPLAASTSAREGGFLTACIYLPATAFLR